MASASNGQASIIRTERGLTIAGTRITLYDVMDHLVAGWTPKLILNWLPLVVQKSIGRVDIGSVSSETGVA